MSEQVTFEVSGREFFIEAQHMPVSRRNNEPIVITYAETPVSPSAEPTIEANLTDPILLLPMLAITGLTAFAVRATTPKSRR